MLVLRPTRCHPADATSARIGAIWYVRQESTSGRLQTSNLALPDDAVDAVCFEVGAWRGRRRAQRRRQERRGGPREPEGTRRAATGSSPTRTSGACGARRAAPTRACAMRSHVRSCSVRRAFLSHTRATSTAPPRWSRGRAAAAGRRRGLALHIGDREGVGEARAPSHNPKPRAVGDDDQHGCGDEGNEAGHCRGGDRVR